MQMFPQQEIINLCTDYLCLQKVLLNFSHKGFENITFNDISIIGITELLMNVKCCHRFVNDKKKTVILACHTELISYY